MKIIPRAISIAFKKLYSRLPSGQKYFAFKRLLEIRDKLYRFRGQNYSILEAVFWPMRIDAWYRYASVADEITKEANLSVLDVGTGDARFLRLLGPRKYDLFGVDNNRDRLRQLKDVGVIIADGRNLPFRNSSFDIVTSIDMIEHMPKNRRNECLEELKRVTSDRVVLHSPVKDSKGCYEGEKYDIKFNEAYENVFGSGEKRTVEHITCGYVTINELKATFPNARFIGTQNCEVWYKYMILAHCGFLPLKFFNGVFYLLFLKKNDNQAPYHACKIVWKKRQSKHIVNGESRQ